MPAKRTVADVMTREVVTLNEEQNLEHVLEGLERFGFRHLPVVDGKKLVGLVTRRDLLRTAVSRFSPEAAAAAQQHSLEENLFVASIMHRNIATVDPTTPLADAANQMLDNEFRCLPVVDADGNLVGIVTDSDFLEIAAILLARE